MKRHKWKKVVSIKIDKWSRRYQQSTGLSYTCLCCLMALWRMQMHKTN